MLMKKSLVLALALAFLALAGLLAACGSDPAGIDSSNATNAESFDASKNISLVSREDGSGTRGAFIELFGILKKADDGTETDLTSVDAQIVKQTDVMLQTVSGDPYAIGYVSMGSLNDQVKALTLDGVKPTVENVNNGTYTAKRPFNIATKGAPKGLAKDFIDFIMAKEGQDIIGTDYIAVNAAAAPYAGNEPSGKIVVAGSSSVTPVMEQLIEAYKAINTGAEIELQTSDSSMGLQAAIDGTADIAMASRDLKEEELAQLTELTIAQDGIALIVNQANPLTTITIADVAGIFTGEMTTWDAVSK